MFDKACNIAIRESLNIKELTLHIEKSQLDALDLKAERLRNGFLSKPYMLK